MFGIRDYACSHARDHLKSKREAGMRLFFFKLRLSKAAAYMEELRNTRAYPGKMHAQKSPKKMLRLHDP